MGDLIVIAELSVGRDQIDQKQNSFMSVEIKKEQHQNYNYGKDFTR